MEAAVDLSTILQFKKVNCKNCYKCVRYCPVKAIKVRNHQAQIIESQCILCEKCTVICPQNAKVELNRIPDVEKGIANGEQMIASIHPAYLAKFGVPGFKRLAAAMKKLGFTEAFEAAQGAYLMKKQYEKVLQERKQQKMTISSACPVIVQMIEKHYPSLVPYLAPVLSMMQSHGKYLKQQYPQAKVVYISPCISSMAELKESENYVDYVITFQELNEWLEREGLSVQEGEVYPDRYLSRVMALPDGITLAMRPLDGQKYLSIHGMDNCKKILEELEDSSYDNCFLELSSCLNGCIDGPSFQKGQRKLLDAMLSIRNASLEHGVPNYGLDYSIEDGPDLTREFGTYVRHKKELASQEEIQDILAQMGKFSPKDELNCGACGYDTCREKAMAISENKAEISMCVPYMRERQESYSNKIVNAMPGLLITVDYQLNIIHMNQAARALFGIRTPKEMAGKPVADLMDDFSLANLVAFDKNLSQDQVYLKEKKCYLDRVMTNDRKNRLILCVMKDVTREMTEKARIRRSQVEAARMADKLVEEQLKIVHQIAGLLGETAADTKVAVEELKNTILLENKKENEKK